MIAVITAIREELAPILRRATVERVVRIGGKRHHVGALAGVPVVMVAGGVGAGNAERSALKLLESFDVRALIGAGIAGAIEPSLAFGDVLVASSVIARDRSAIDCDASLAEKIASLDDAFSQATIHTLPRIVATAAEKQALARELPQVAAVDMESSGWARAAARSSVPFIAVRTIFDSAVDEIPDFVAAAGHEDGSFDRNSVMWHAMRHPGTIPTLLQMREKVRASCEVLGSAVARAIGSLADAGASRAAEERLQQLLVETSRTFALCIPQLPEATRRQVTIAYLLFRIADTFEDASHWSVPQRLRALEEFRALMADPTEQRAAELAAVWHAQSPSSHAGYDALVAETQLVVRSLMALPADVGAIIREHVTRSAEGMAEFVAMTADGSLQLTDLGQLHAYCYAVAGIVGEMLTELFLIRAPQLRSSAQLLRSRAAAFGEGLQLVNILKDSASDSSEGRTYIPRNIDRASIFSLARTDLEAAAEYTLALQSGGAAPGIISFAALPVALAEATLDHLEESAPGAKIGRAEVFRITRAVNRSVARGEPPLPRRSVTMSGLARMREILSLPFGSRT